MTMTTTELPALLRGAVTWRDGRPWADNDALLIVADWCEDEGRADDAEAIREAMGWPDEDAFFDSVMELTWEDDRDGLFREPASFRFGEGQVCVQRMSAGSAQSLAMLGQRRAVGTYETSDDEYTERPMPNFHDQPQYSLGGLQRIRDLARWDLICHMLGWPPLRLVGEG
jgi:hypothetical protein